MKKILLSCVLFLMACSTGICAVDKKISDLDENTTPLLNAFVVIAGDGVNQKVSLTNLIHADDAINITSFTNNKNDLENGTSVTSTILNWTINDTVTSESLNNSIGSITASLRTYTHTSTYTTNRTYTITVSDGTHTDVASTAVRFLNPNYYGASSSTTLNDAQINAFSHSLGTSKTQTRSIVPANQHIHIVYPASYGTAIFTVNGFLDNAWTCGNQSHVNSSGATLSYTDCYTNNLLTGTFLIGVQ